MLGIKLGSLLLLTEIAHVKIAVWRRIGKETQCAMNG